MCISVSNMTEPIIRNRGSSNEDGPVGVDEAGIYESEIHLRRQVRELLLLFVSFFVVFVFMFFSCFCLFLCLFLCLFVCIFNRYTLGPRYWNAPVLVNTDTLLVCKYCLKM